MTFIQKGLARNLCRRFRLRQFWATHTYYFENHWVSVCKRCKGFAVGVHAPDRCPQCGFWGSWR